MLRSYLGRFSRALALIVLCVVVAVAEPVFLTAGNLLNVARQASLLLGLSAGMTMVILVGGTDLSVGAIAALSSCVAAPFFLKGAGPLRIAAGLLVALAIGGIAGLSNGLMISGIGLPPFVATYGMNQLARGIALAYMAGHITYGFEPAFRYLGAGSFHRVPVPVVAAILVALVFHFILSRTVLGRQVYVVGARPSVAAFSGISVPGTMLRVYTLNGLVAAFGGLMFISRLNAAEAGLGETFALQAIGAVAIGGTSFRGGIGGVGGTVIGALIVTVLTNAMNLLGVSTLWQTAATGGVIILAVLLDQGLAARREGGPTAAKRARLARTGA